MSDEPVHQHDERVSLTTIATGWLRIGVTGFGGPPAHIAMFRSLCVDRHQWLTAPEFEDAIAATNLLPGPASTQLAIYCAWRLRGRTGAILGGLCFIVPGLILILGLASVFLASHPPSWILGAAAGAGAAVPAVAAHAADGLRKPSWHRAGESGRRARWLVYASAGVLGAIFVGASLVLLIVGLGVAEVLLTHTRGNGAGPRGHRAILTWPVATVTPLISGGVAALAWVALKVGALSYGGGFVIVPLMQHDAVVTYHWMTGGQFLDAVALGQITPGPVVQTVAVVGYAASGLGGGLLAALVAFTPSFLFILLGARHFNRIRTAPRIQAFFFGAGATVIGAIAGSAVTLALEWQHLWQVGLAVVAAGGLFLLGRSVVLVLLFCAAAGIVASLVGWPT